ncbi:MAG TPA: hypothetical protein VG796_06650 [Verrucomicrobiales bacterium]|nr:hypothetical protein [Verrucomicrobiales bacterium]
MKITRLLAAGFAASSIFLAACDKKGEDAKGGGSGGASTTVSEKDAIEALKKDAAEIKAMSKAGEESKDPMAQMTMIKPMLAKMQAIKTEGLPADLKTALEEAKIKIGEMAVLFKDLPAKKEEVMAWAQKAFADPTLQTKMQKIGEEVKATGEKLKDVAKKYGVDMDMN